MAVPHEVEAKFKVEDLKHVREALRRVGARCLGAAVQTDRYFDTPDKRLLAGDEGVRVRTVRQLRGAGPERDTRPQITYKGPARKRATAKIRREIETRVDDAAAVQRILQALGLKVIMTVTKRRASYRLGRCRVELDRLPVIGCFVEIEADTERRVLAAARKLGLRGEPIKDHYVALLTAASGSRGPRRPGAPSRRRAKKSRAG